MEPKLGRLDANLEQILDWLERGGDGRREPGRLSRSVRSSGYGFSSREEGLDHAVAVDSDAVRRVVAACDAASDASACSDCSSATASRLFNACVLVGPEGVVGTYRKVHLPFLGIDMFVDPGDRPFAVHDAGGLKIGMHICYDGGFPETARVLAFLGADLLVLPTNWPTHSECAAEHMIPTRAMENTVYVMAVNRVGEESGFRFIGTSSIVDPGGRVWPRPGRDTEEMLSAEIDPAARARNTWSASRAGTRSTGSPIAGRGFTRPSSRPTGATECLGSATGRSREHGWCRDRKGNGCTRRSANPAPARLIMADDVASPKAGARMSQTGGGGGNVTTSASSAASY